MTKKDEDYLEEIANNDDFIDPEASELVSAYAEEERKSLKLFEEAEQLIDLSAVLDDAGFNAEQIPLHELSGRPFVIRWMNSFESSFQPGQKCFHAICYDYETKQVFRTVIGCKNGTDILERLEADGIRSGIKICFEYVTGKGRHGKYYRLV